MQRNTQQVSNRIKVDLLSIPNFWMPYYIHGLAAHPSIQLRLRPDAAYRSFNFLNRCVLKITSEGCEQLVILDLDDPTERHFSYHDQFDHIFLSQKRTDWIYPSGEKYHALYPHFPLRSFEMFTIQGIRMFLPSRIIQNLKQFRAILRQKPLWLVYVNDIPRAEAGYIFYKRALWKNLPEVNMLGARFLDISQRLGFRIDGGLTRTVDDYRTGIDKIDKYVTKKRLSKSDFITNSFRSELCFSTPSINGSCSWRMGEYLAMDKPIVTTPMKVELPEGLNYLEVSDDPDMFEEQVEQLLRHPDRFRNLSNRDLFLQKIHPIAQIDYILETIGFQ